ncbi:helix-turn-helix domain-containing protein [Flavobacterium sp. NRK F7]|uniref:helix-turn-helix domain-containing protein n=1 Tax=Flavobacterium sp. NRK F7 TaxID=2954930 RepID=UPI00209130E2|nr:helix-turn-helix transcriptional regulator [Flavobacterium sp. NRK F7]MCO6162218.1 helix-turn-helix transcriptional regulator [Flavobacterium sp. NRK F7]
MKKENLKITELLGMKQEEVALILEISRSHWSMYESGKRNLPTSAKLKLAEILTFVQQPETFWKKQFPFLNEKKNEKKKVLEDLLVMNKHNQLVTNNKLNDIKKKYDISVNRLKVMLYFESNPIELNNNADDLLFEIMNNGAKINLEKKGDLVQMEYEIKLETLKKEEEIIKYKLQNLV